MLRSLILTGAAAAALAPAPPARAAPPLALAAAAAAEDAAVRRLDEVLVTGDPLRRELPEVDGAKIYVGKRVGVALLTDQPTIEGANFRQAFSEIPGLLVSEVSNASWQSVSYRGLGEPHESWNILTLKDGLPVSPDLYSYPAAYYTPPLDTVERVEVLRGGAGLLYGPQPGGVINYVSRTPAPGREGLYGEAKAVAGSDGLSAALGAVYGRAGAWSAWGYARVTQGEGPRRANSDFDQRANALRLRYDGAAFALTVGLDLYDGRFGEPGGLTAARFAADPRGVSTPVDRLAISRTAPFVKLDATLGAWLAQATLFHSRYERTSRRQAGGAFGMPTPGANVAILQTQDFDNTGLDLRVRRDFDAFGDIQSLTVGLLAFTSDAPVRVDKGLTAVDGTGGAGALARADRAGDVTALFGEVRLGFGKLIVAPGVRVERIEQSVRERLDLGAGSATGGPPGGPNGALGARDATETVTLWGLGLTYPLGARATLTANASTGFKPKLFNDGVTFQSGVDAAGTFEATDSLTVEAGVVARPTDWIALEASAFFVRLEDQVGFLAGPLPAAPPFGAVGAGGARRQNVGTMENLGLDLAGAVKLFGPQGGLFATRADSLRLQANVQLLDAEFVGGPARGRTPQYAPAHLARASLAYASPDGLKAALYLTAVADQQGSDNGAAEFAIPAYTVVDASLDWPIARTPLTLTAGVNNLFDEAYAARVRPGGGGGIDPGAPRNGYVGLSVRF